MQIGYINKIILSVWLCYMRNAKRVKDKNKENNTFALMQCTGSCFIHSFVLLFHLALGVFNIFLSILFFFSPSFYTISFFLYLCLALFLEKFSISLILLQGFVTLQAISLFSDMTIISTV